MALLLGELFDSFVELPVLLLRLFLLKLLHLLLLLQKSCLNLLHVLVRLHHLCEEIVRPTDGHLRLNQNLHAFDHILPSLIVEQDFAFDVVVDL